MSLEFIITSLVSAIIAVLVSRYFSTRTKVQWGFARKKVLDPIGGGLPEGITINLDGHEIDNLVEVRVGIWNSGNTPVRSSDFVGERVFSLTIPDGVIVKVQKPIVSRDAVHFDAVPDADTLRIETQNVMDVGDFFLTTLYVRLQDASIEFSRKNEPKLSAAIIGMPRGPSLGFRPFILSWRDSMFSFIIFVSYIFLGFVFALSGAYGIGYRGWVEKVSSNLGSYTEVPTAISWLLLFFGLMWMIFAVIFVIIVFISLISQPPRRVSSELYESGGIGDSLLRRLRAKA